MSDINNNKTQDMSDRDITMWTRYARQRDNYVGQDMPDREIIMLDKICPTKIVIQSTSPSYLFKPTTF